MSAASGIGLTMPSGLDDNSLINALVSIQQQSVTTVQNTVAKDQNQISDYAQIGTLARAIGTDASGLAATTAFDVFAPSTSKADAVTISGGAGASAGQYDVNVYQLASNEKMISKDGLITSRTASLSSFGITAGTFSIDGTTIVIHGSDTIQDLASKINSATDKDGKALNVSASVIQVSASDYRLVLINGKSGNDGAAYKDVSGSTLQDLGIIANADGDKGNVSQVVQSSADVASAFNALAAGASIKIEGKDHAGNDVSLTYTKNSGETIDKFLSRLSDTFNGTAAVTTDESGHLVVTDKIAGTSNLSIKSLSLGGTSYEMDVSQGGENGAGVLHAGSNAYYSVDGMLMNSNSNAVTGFAAGTTIQLNGLAATTSVTVGLKVDTGAITTKVQQLVSDYNTLKSYIETQTKIASTTDANSKDGDLAGDMSARSILDQITSIFMQAYGAGGANNPSSLAQVGLNTDPNSGSLSLDADKFKAALQKNLEGVVNLFAKIGTADQPGVSLGRSTKDTKPGTYELQQVDPTHVRIRQKGSSQWYASDPINGQIVSFSDGPVKGLSLTVTPGSIGDSTMFTYSKGVGTSLNDLITAMTDPVNGIITVRQQSLQRSITDANQQITTLQAHIESYRAQLTRQFSQMETMISSFKSDSSRITSSFGSN